MRLPWFPLLACLVGVAGTRVNLLVRHALQAHQERPWWLLTALAWLPLVCWIASQFVFQD